jgi:hypothetical protein
MVKAKKTKTPRDPSFLGVFVRLCVDAGGVVQSFRRFDPRFQGLSYDAAMRLLESTEKPGHPKYPQWVVYHFFRQRDSSVTLPEMIPAEFEQLRQDKAWVYRFTDVRDDYGIMRITVHHRNFNYGGNDDDL